MRGHATVRRRPETPPAPPEGGSRRARHRGRLASIAPRRFLLLGAFVALAAVMCADLTRKLREVPSPFIDKPAPPFMLPRLDDAARSRTAAEMKGQVWVLNAWASRCALWCGPSTQSRHRLPCPRARRAARRACWTIGPDECLPWRAVAAPHDPPHGPPLAGADASRARSLLDHRRSTGRCWHKLRRRRGATG